MAEHDTAAGNEIHALLGAGTRYEGKLLFDGRVRIDGRFTGEIASDGVLIIGEGAEIEASIAVGTLIVRGGRVVGDVQASELVEIHAPGRIDGDIRTPELFMEKGVVFEGHCSMGGAPAAVHTFEAPEPKSGTRPAVSAPSGRRTAERG